MLRRYLLVYLLVTASAATAQENAKTSFAARTPGTVLATGANRGLGLEFVRQYAAAGWNVIATARDPEHAAELRALAAGNRKIAIDALDHAEFERVMDVNVYGALAVAEAFRDSVAASSQKKIVSITSRSGEISQPGYRGPYFYRASKIALNMVMRVLADDLRERGVIVALVAPYPTDTEMLRTLIWPEAAAHQALPKDSVAGMIRVISELTLENSATPLLADGKTLPW